MIAIDTNILIYAHRSDSPSHASASERIRVLAESGQSWAIPWPCVHEFLSVATNPKILRPATPMTHAIHQIEVWMESGTLSLLAEGSNYWLALKTLITDGQVIAAQTHDARIAALCLQHGVSELWTADRDFSRYPDLKTRNPLIA